LFEEAVGLGADAPSVAKWITQDVAGLLNAARVDLAGTRLTAGHLADLVRLVGDGTVSATGAKQALEEAFETGDDMEAIVERRGLEQVQDASALGAWVDEAIAENPGPVEQYLGGKEGALNAVMGQVIKKSGGAANPKAVRELLLQRLSRS
jgi:aspartyl-tRNA(Asn)/glutamyl-tRNA(Gln) amidotransferase subunit B